MHSPHTAAGQSLARNPVSALLARYSAHEAPSTRLGGRRSVRRDGLSAVATSEMNVEMAIRVQRRIHGMHRTNYRTDTIHARLVL
jgi:hypothetical protein